MCKPRGPASGCQPCCLGLTNIRVPSCHQAHQCLTLPLCPLLPLLVQPLWQRPLSSEVITSHRFLVYILHRSLHDTALYLYIISRERLCTLGCLHTHSSISTSALRALRLQTGLPCPAGIAYLLLLKRCHFHAQDCVEVTVALSSPPRVPSGRLSQFFSFHILSKSLV